MTNQIIAKPFGTTQNLLILFLLFCVNPLLGIGIAILYALRGDDYNKCLPLLLMICLYMAALNSTKLVESDLEEYVSMYENVPFRGYLKTLSYLTDDDRIHEVVYGTMVYFLYYATFGHASIFVAILSFLIYFFLLISFFEYGRRNSLQMYVLVSGVLTISFFTQYFSLTAHLIRQLLATSIMMYAIVWRDISLKRYILWCVVAFNIHNSMALLILLSAVPFFVRWLTKKQLILFCGISFGATLSFMIVASFILERLTGQGDIVSTLSRASSAVGQSDGNEANMLAIMIVTIPMLLMSIYAIIKKRILECPIYFNICLAISIFVLNLSFAPLIQYRIFYVLYSFIPFVLFPPLRHDSEFTKRICFIIPVFFILLFYFSLERGAFTYCTTLEALLLPYPSLLQF